MVEEWSFYGRIVGKSSPGPKWKGNTPIKKAKRKIASYKRRGFRVIPNVAGTDRIRTKRTRKDAFGNFKQYVQETRVWDIYRRVK